ncbi:MAG: type pilus secretin PilQ [Deferribacteraceae bacterium]|jgi:type IV pilus assembly protein PilQ|nr:type pilus secretin PilQ [Deferribacteraceae bacterium]
MRIYKLFVVAISLILMVACASKKEQASNMILQKKIKAISVEKSAEGKYVLNLTGDNSVKYKIYYSKSPYKLTVLAADTLFSEEAMKYSYSDEVITKTAAFISEQGATLEVYLNSDANYTFDEKDGNLKVDLQVVKPEIKDLGDAGIEFNSAEFENVELGKNVLSISNLSDDNNLLLKIGLDGVVKYDFGYLNDKLLYIDIFDVNSQIAEKILPGKGMVRRIKVGSYYPPQKVRFLVDINMSNPIFAGQNGKYLILSNEVTNVPRDDKYITSIESIAVKKYQSIIIKLTGNPVYTKKVVNGNLVLEFGKGFKALKSVKNTMAFANLPFRKVTVGKIADKLSIIVVPNGEIYAKVEKVPEGVMISGSFNNFSKAEDVLKAQEIQETAKKEDTGVKSYDKKDLVNLSIKDMDVREAIRLIYFGRNKNIVFGNEVKGNVSLFVKNVHYQKALDIIYKENNLIEIDEDNVVWVISKARKDEIESKKLQEIKNAQQKQELEPLVTEIIPVNYSAASDYKGVLDSVLSARGKLQIENRTNSFVITDTKENIEKAKNLLAEIDKPTPQVTIEARIVEVNNSNDMNIGIQWGGRVSRSTTAYDFPGTINLTGNTGATSSAGNGYLVNLPLGNFDTSVAAAGGLALSLGSISGKYGLDIALSALESQNKVKIVSSPRVTTLDNQEAEINSGGVAKIVPPGDNTDTEEVEYGIILKVKPHITANKMVYMEILVEKSALEEISSNTLVTNNKKAKTQVLLASGDTTVIGGIYENEEKNVTYKVPGLGDIPILGWLFKSKGNSYQKKELLVFLTPKIVEK